MPGRGSSAPIPARSTIQTPALDPIVQLNDHERRIRALELEPRTANVPPFTFPGAVDTPITPDVKHPVIHRHRVWQVWFTVGGTSSGNSVASIYAWEDPSTLIHEWNLSIGDGEYVAFENVKGAVSVPHLGYFTVSADAGSGEDWALGVTLYRDE
jgi:hypothetical protein